MSSTTSSTPHPRRRLDRLAKQCQSLTSPMPLRKGVTFHSPKSPSASDDPVIHVPSLPRRSPTCPRTLQKLVAASERRALDLIDSCFTENPDLAAASASPVPRFLLANVNADLDTLGIDKKIKPKTRLDTASAVDVHHHGSDSGLGSSVESSPVLRRRSRTNSAALSTDSVYSEATNSTAAINKSLSSLSVTDSPYLSDYATKQIKKHIVDPILQLQSLKEFHYLISDLPHRISDRHITCLRDLEKTLIFLAPARSSSPASYLNFCETSIQCIHATVDHLNEADQRRPTDRPYTNNYFLDLVEQVRQYARIMAATRQKQANGEELDETDYSPDEKLTVIAGPSSNGKPAEIVREKNGKMIAIGGDAVLKRTSSNLSEDEDDIARSMARKRKCDIGKEEIHPCTECGKEFKRPCDLTKHAKTHSRPWKCPESDCKYADLGWPTEKERDRHVNDKHSMNPPSFSCHFEGCTYTSKRESNCKQHMEKSHGWEYVRSKSKNSQKQPGTGMTPQTPLMPTPSSASAFPSITTPLTPFAPSPSDFSTASTSRDASMAPGANDVFKQNFGNSNVLFDMYNNTYVTPIEQTGMANTGFDFTTYDQTLNMPAVPYTPALSDGHHDSFSTPNSNLTHSSPEFSIPPNSFEEGLNANDWPMDSAAQLYPSVAEFFPQYNNTQQPTPALSDREYLSDQPMVVDNTNNASGISPHGHDDMLFYDSSASSVLHNDEGFDGTFPAQGDDFTLYGDMSGVPASVGNLFPELATQFDGSANHPYDFNMQDDIMEDYMFNSHNH